MKKINRTSKAISISAYIFVLTIFNVSFSAVGSELPDDVKNLVEKRQQAVNRINSVFVEELKKLKLNYTRTGNLNTANAIVSLVEQYEVVNDADEDQDMSSLLKNTTWAWFRNESVTFLDNGRARWSYNDQESFSWRITNQKARVVSGITPRGVNYKITFSKCFTKGTILENNRERLTNIMK